MTYTVTPEMLAELRRQATGATMPLIFLPPLILALLDEIERLENKVAWHQARAYATDPKDMLSASRPREDTS